MTIPTVIHRFLQQAITNPDRDALVFREANDHDAFELVTATYGQLAHSVSILADTLEEIGIKAGEHVVQIAGNSLQWIVWDFALQSLGAVHIPLSPLRGAKELANLIEHCQPGLLVLEGQEQVEQLNEVKFPWHRQTVVSDNPTQLPGSVEAISLPESIMHPQGREAGANAESLRKRSQRLMPGQLMTIIYTSGTIGRPKGVMLSHKNIAENVDSLLKVSPIRSDETRLCVLPLSHVYARTNDLYANFCSGSCLALGDPRNLVQECLAFRPNFINGVPYLFEKCMKQFLEQQPGQTLVEFLGGRIEKVNTGGASVSSVVESFFWNNELPMITGYGLTETAPVLAASSVNQHKQGTVGRALPGVELKLAEDGEIMTRGDNLMMGYFKDPQLTADAMRDGWFHTGDLGSIDSAGFVTVLGRKDEMIVTSTGHNVLPLELEMLIKQHPGINHVCVVGNGQAFLTAIINTEHRFDDLERFKHEINALLVDRWSHEKIGKLIIADEEFTVANGSLTTKGNLRRHEIEKRWG